MSTHYLLAIDQGTSSTRAIIFDASARQVSMAQRELKQYYPQNGWVEHDPMEIWQATLATCQEALARAKLTAKQIHCAGITNQRETTVMWHTKTGRPLYRAIVWQDRRTAEHCKLLRQEHFDKDITQKTGLLLDPYFSATKMQWLLDTVPEARTLAKKNELAIGTIDSFLLWCLTNGTEHKTDVTNAARTLLFNIDALQWDPELLKCFNIPPQILPTVHPNNAHFGSISATHLGATIPITAMIGDQQSATVGQACFEAGMLKSTYGTGCFLLLNTGKERVHSRHQLLSTIAYQIDNTTHYALEGTIFNAGTAVQWLRDNLQLIGHANETENIARSLNDNGGVYMIPAFTGLGAPHWEPQARGAIIGLTRDSDGDHLIRAALESVCYQTNDLVQCMKQDAGRTLKTIRVDGGMVANTWLLQFLSDMTECCVERPQHTETTALGAALLAGLGAGLYTDLNDIARHWNADATFHPTMAPSLKQSLYTGWQTAVKRVL